MECFLLIKTHNIGLFLKTVLLSHSKVLAINNSGNYRCFFYFLLIKLLFEYLNRPLKVPSAIIENPCHEVFVP